MGYTMQRCYFCKNAENYAFFVRKPTTNEREPMLRVQPFERASACALAISAEILFLELQSGERLRAFPLCLFTVGP